MAVDLKIPAGKSSRCWLEGKVGHLLIDEPPVNILSIEALERLKRSLAEVLKAEPDVLVVRAAGSRAFSAGVEVRDHVPAKVPQMLESLHSLIGMLWDSGTVALGVVTAPARGGGAELLMSCDLVIGTPTASFGFPEITLGCFPPVGCSLLPRRVGPLKANYLVLTGKAIGAYGARDAGLVNEIVEPGQLDAKLQEYISDMTGKSGAVRRIALARLRDGWVPEARQQIAKATEAYTGQLLATQDVVEGVSAFLERRAPVWTGH
jgi:cyclohexa-1,5-dienecarbonyl-CoA hydratase